MKTPVYYRQGADLDGGHCKFYIFEQSDGDIAEIHRVPFASTYDESKAKEICDAINGSKMTTKEEEYRKFVALLQQQRAEAGVETKDMLSSKLTFLLAHAAMGMVTEAAEIMDIVKKHLVYKRPLDFTKLKDECGDSMFYLTMAIMECDSNYNEIIDMNTAKLTARYKGKYTHDAANVRDLEAEKKAQETAAANMQPICCQQKLQNNRRKLRKDLSGTPPTKREEPPIVRDERA